MTVCGCDGVRGDGVRGVEHTHSVLVDHFVVPEINEVDNIIMLDTYTQREIGCKQETADRNGNLCQIYTNTVRHVRNLGTGFSIYIP